MIYLDYAANTPTDEEVLQSFVETSRKYPGNPNSPHQLGQEARLCLRKSTEQIATLLNAKPEEVIFTSGASEANNLAIKGIAKSHKKYGKHMITSYLEHASVTGAFTSLQQEGFEIDFVDILSDGTINLEHLKELLRQDTILVSIGWVDSEIGIIQPFETIHQLLEDYPNCLFHVDATQGVGKIPVSFQGIDLLTFSSHKFYGINGSGILLKKEELILEPMIHGGLSTTSFRSGTPTVALSVSTERALTMALESLSARYEKVKQWNQKLREQLLHYKEVQINSPKKSSPYILNISLKGLNSNVFQQKLDAQGICVATKSACCAPNTVSRPVYALTKNRKLALSTLRISLSHFTTEEEINYFLKVFDQCIKEK